MKEWFKARNIWGAAICALSDEEAGRLAKALWSYTMTGERQEIQGAENALLAMILLTLSEDEKRDAEISTVRALAGAKGGKQTQANARQTEAIAKQTEANASNCSNKNKNKNKNKKEEQELYFERFWTAYPRKVNKPGARKAFEKINPDETLLETMLKAIEQQKRSAQWQEVQYIPHPATWLNGHRWEDSVIPAKQPFDQRDYSGVQDEMMQNLAADIEAFRRGAV